MYPNIEITVTSIEPWKCGCVLCVCVYNFVNLEITFMPTS